jgi:DNA polymerase V
LTRFGYELWCELNGDPVTPIRPARTRHRMIARGGSLAGKVRDPRTLYGWLVRNVERLVEELQFHEVRPAVMTVHVSYFEAAGAGGVVHLDVPSDRFATLLEAAKVGLARAWRPGKVATHMHLVASDLRRQGAWQASLFYPPDPREETVARVKRGVNERFGRFRLRSGATLFANDFYQDAANEHDVRDIRGKFCF